MMPCLESSLVSCLLGPAYHSVACIGCTGRSGCMGRIDCVECVGRGKRYRRLESRRPVYSISNSGQSYYACSLLHSGGCETCVSCVCVSGQTPPAFHVFSAARHLVGAQMIRHPRQVGGLRWHTHVMSTTIQNKQPRCRQTGRQRLT
jgi:hypothetical protein